MSRRNFRSRHNYAIRPGRTPETEARIIDTREQTEKGEEIMARKAHLDRLYDCFFSVFEQADADSEINLGQRYYAVITARAFDMREAIMATHQRFQTCKTQDKVDKYVIRLEELQEQVDEFRRELYQLIERIESCGMIPAEDITDIELRARIRAGAEDLNEALTAVDQQDIKDLPLEMQHMALLRDESACIGGTIYMEGQFAWVNSLPESNPDQQRDKRLALVGAAVQMRYFVTCVQK